MHRKAYFAKRIKSIISVCLITFGIANAIQAQKKSISKNNELWIQYYSQISLSEKWVWLTDGGYRWNGFFSGPSQFIVRTGFGKNLNGSFRLAAGFAHLGFYSEEILNQFEYRPYQEVQLKNSLNKTGITQRLRLEERFFRNRIDHSGSFNFRFRYMLQFNIPVMNMISGHPDKMLALNIGDEIFINAGNDITYNVFDQNRLLIGPAFQANANLEVKLTYNSLFAADDSPGEYKHAHIFWVGINQILDFRN